MRISRREFLKYCVSSAALLGLDASAIGQLQKAFAASGPGIPTVIWLSTATCTGCTVSLANRISATEPLDVADLLINHIDLAFHPNLMGAAGDLAVANLRNATKNPYVLAVEGGIPTAFNGNTCLLWTENGQEITALDAVRQLSANSIANLAIGTCASFGGISAAAPNPTQIQSLSAAIGKPTINIAGCPAHPDWIIWTIAQLIAGIIPALDSSGRPSALYGGENNNVHENCPRQDRSKATTFGVDSLCMRNLGCKGPSTQADCPKRLWNNGTNWCIGANSQCMGCTDSRFPDGFSPMYSLTAVTGTGPALFEVVSAAWNNTSKQLTVSGKGTPASTVIVEEYLGALIGQSVPNSSGAWTLTVNNPAAVPVSIVAKLNADVLFAPVSNVPAMPPPLVFTISNAQWIAASNQLYVQGTGAAAAVVVIQNAGGTTLGQTTIAANGQWTYTLTNPATIPATVTATSQGQSLTVQVSNVPPPPPPPVVFAISNAQWIAGSNQLNVQGTGVAAAVVVIKNSSGITLGQTPVTANGQWMFTLTNPASIPSTIIASSQGQSLTVSVSNVPLPPPPPPPSTVLTITRAVWDYHNRTLTVSGQGKARARVTVSNATSGKIYTTTTISSDGSWSVRAAGVSSQPGRVRAVSGLEIVEKSVVRINMSNTSDN
ncbi:MAG: hydrogenase small subunit [Candidatus Omnitrophica bacterium]|nr:hydrogenase small subunit [Candidatus Omnitrophota bacterium]